MKNKIKHLLALALVLTVAVTALSVTAAAAPAGVPDSYDFTGMSGTAVPAGWTIAGDRDDSDLWSFDNGLKLRTHFGDIYEGTNTAKNIFVQEADASGDWTVEAKVNFSAMPNGPYQQAALVFYVDDNNYVKFSYEYNEGNVSNKPVYDMIAQLAVEEGGSFTSSCKDMPTDNEVYLRLQKSGYTFTGAVSFDGITFPEANKVVRTIPEEDRAAFTSPKLAIMANNGGDSATGAIDATFAYVSSDLAGADAVEAAIEALPATITAETDVPAVRAAYDALDTLEKKLINNLSKLTDAEDDYDAAKADAVEALINAIPDSITAENSNKVTAARTAYSALTTAQQAKVLNITKLENAEAALTVVNKIDAIPDPVTVDSGDVIAAARTAYSALTDAQRAMVGNTSKLIDAEAAYDAAKAAAVEALINDIPDSITAADSNTIAAARAAYDALTTAQQALVTNLAKLTNAEAALPVVNKIDAIGDVDYTDEIEAKINAAADAFGMLTEAQKAAVSNVAVLTAAQAEYAALKKSVDDFNAAVNAIYPVDLEDGTAITAAEKLYADTIKTPGQKAKAAAMYQKLVDARKVFDVMTAIAAIGDVDYTDEIKDKIDAAADAFGKLTEDQKAAVSNDDILTAAQAEYAALKKSVDDFNAAVNAIYPVDLKDGAAITAAEKLYADTIKTPGQKAKAAAMYQKLVNAREAYDVMAAIGSIGTVTLGDRDKLAAIRAAYEALTEAQKALVANLNELKAAEQQYQEQFLYTLLMAGSAFPFKDVDPDAWYYDCVRDAWANNLIDGMSKNEFQPEGNLTVAQAIKLAAALNQMSRHGKVRLGNGDTVWYSTYVDYAVANGIIDASYAYASPARMNAPVSRREFVKIFYGALPETDYAAFNNVRTNAIPDVKAGDACADEIYTFYRAGILTGSDAYGTFYPGSSIKRCEVAAILIRMYDNAARQYVYLP